jgi:hypothetical protein
MSHAGRFDPELLLAEVLASTLCWASRHGRARVDILSGVGFVWFGV